MVGFNLISIIPFIINIHIITTFSLSFCLFVVISIFCLINKLYNKALGRIRIDSASYSAYSSGLGVSIRRPTKVIVILPFLTKRYFSGSNKFKTLLFRVLGDYQRWSLLSSESGFALMPIFTAGIVSSVGTLLFMNFNNMVCIQIYTILGITLMTLLGLYWLVFFTDVRNKSTFNSNVLRLCLGFIGTLCLVCTNYFMPLWILIFSGVVEAGIEVLTEVATEQTTEVLTNSPKSLTSTTIAIESTNVISVPSSLEVKKSRHFIRYVPELQLVT